MVARVWRGAVALADGDSYAAHLVGEDKRIADYTAVPGNVGAWVLRRDVGGRAEFLMFSVWESMEAVRAYAGTEPDKPVFYAEDERLLIERDEVVAHFSIVGQATANAA